MIIVRYTLMYSNILLYNVVEKKSRRRKFRKIYKIDKQMFAFLDLVCYTVSGISEYVSEKDTKRIQMEE